ncbi:hypothetical protein LF41_2105 [Lysobacter dokdonensis DS-58]|uniref:Transmembrane protein n=2 Tax=Noviluteimonas TaxID=3382693 RepID=A0A0A2WIY3_9GAMM|nr:hypothetical protein LF41_2105 [Lysobacter dokdonensis DS-58]
MFEADARALRTSAPTPPPPWRIAQAARARAARRLARRVRWLWRIATIAFVAAAIPVVLHDPRTLPGLVAPLLLGALACWRDEPGVPRDA